MNVEPFLLQALSQQLPTDVGVVFAGGTASYNLTAGFNSSFNATTTGDKSVRNLSIFTITVIIVISTILSLVTVIGNLMVMISFRIDKQLQTISNYYLFSLAVADIAIGAISMPLFTIYTVMGYWPLGPLVCDTWLALDYLASNASVLNLLIISFDRYFSVTKPLTYRAKRTTGRAGFMIGAAWGTSLLLWPPWIYAWPYIEGERTVPETSCYIQFIETNHYITFGTAIAAFYIPVTIMVFLYWRIWRETEKRQKDLPNLQAVRKHTADFSKRSNSRLVSSSRIALSDDVLDMEEGKRPRSESSTGAADEVNSYLDSRYPQHRKHRPLSWTWLKQWCVAWWHSGRDEEEEDDDDDDGGPESSRTGAAYDETLTPISIDTSFMSRGDSFGITQSTSLTLDRAEQQSADYVRATGSGGSRTPGTTSLASKNIPNDSVYTIVIKLPGPPISRGVGVGGGSGRDGQVLSRYGQLEAPSIKMYADDVILEDEPNMTGGWPQALLRRPSQMQPSDVRIPLSAKSIASKGTSTTSTATTPAGGGGGRSGASKASSSGGGAGTSSSGGGGVTVAKQQVKKKKKSQEKKADRKAAKTLSAIIAAFIVTWTPYNILVLVKPLTSCTGCIPQELWELFYYLCYINSTINPVLYALCNATFRRTFIRILTCTWNKRPRTGVNRAF